MSLYGIVGAGGSARTIMPSLTRMLNARRESAACVFVDDDPELLNLGSRDGHEVISFEDFRASECSLALVSHAEPTMKRVWTERCEREGLGFFSVVDPTHLSYSGSSTPDGCAFLAHSMSTVNVTIGNHVHLNIFSYVEHDSIVGNHVTFGPRAGCNGWVEIGDGAYIGAYAAIINGSFRRRIRIGSNATIGMGAIVIDDVPDGATVVGNPARVIKRNGD